MADNYGPASAYITGVQAGQQSRLNDYLLGQRQQQDLLGNQITQEQLSRMREKGATERAQQKAMNEAKILSGILSLPPDQQQQAFDSISSQLDPNTLQVFGADSTGRVAFNPNRAKLLVNMATAFTKFDPRELEKTLTTAQRDYRFYQGLPPEQQQTFISMKRQQAGEAGQVAQARAAGSAVGKAVGGAKVNLQQDISNAEDSISTVQQIIDHPGLDYITGFYSKAPIIPNTPQADAKALMDQIEGQQFLSAYQALRGGGQITEVEGKKATAARSRMVSIVKYGGKKEDFIKAAKEYIGIIQKGMERARRQAGGQLGEQSTSIGRFKVEVVE